ncbi:MAG: hypothetical protein OEO84_06580 [Betaproteobacteria bacterium]|nr:hypothetical protein [Betaproteobacteria bacterium]
MALAAIALIAVLLRPACELWFAHVGAGAAADDVVTLDTSAPLEHDGDSAMQCCATVSEAQQIAPLQAVSGSMGMAEGVAPAALLVMLVGIALFARQWHWLRAPPRRPRSFYLRSARILR